MEPYSPARTRPSSTSIELGPLHQRREGLRIGARHPGLAAQRDDFLEQRGRAARVEMGGDLVEQQDRRGAAAALADKIGSAPGPGRSAGPSARPSSTPWPASPWGRARPSGRSGADRRSVRPAARSRSRSPASKPTVVVLDVDGGPRRERRLRARRRGRVPPRGRRAAAPASRRAPMAAASSATAAARAAAIATPVSAMMRSKPSKRAASRTSSASSRLRCCMARSNCPSAAGSRDRSRRSGDRGSAGARRPGR